MNPLKLISTAAVIVITVVVSLLIVTYKDSIFNMLSFVRQDTVTVFVGENSFSVSVADTPEERRQGLSGTTELADFAGKLFIFDTDSQHGIWMKDMNFALDILWFSRDRTLVHIEKNVTPETYTKERTIFRPSAPARYVLELNAGAVDTLGITETDTLTLPPELLVDS